MRGGGVEVASASSIKTCGSLPEQHLRTSVLPQPAAAADAHLQVKFFICVESLIAVSEGLSDAHARGTMKASADPFRCPTLNEPPTEKPQSAVRVSVSVCERVRAAREDAWNSFGKLLIDLFTCAKLFAGQEK